MSSMSRYEPGGFSGEAYDRNVFEAGLSTVNKLQRDYWNAKQVLRKKFGKSDDECIISSDSELDSKLELFRSVQSTCVDLIRAVEAYQNCICVLSRDENSMGRFLKDQGSQDKTQAGKMMAAVGKSQCFTAQQRLAMRSPLGRLHHDIETFRYRAVGDSMLSIDHMEEARTHYRASLRWMQDISSNLDPEQFKKLEKFRRVQNEVRLNKDKFDRLKWAVCQKVDLLCASRSNLFSTILVPYQNELIKFWEKTARTMSAVLENIKDYQHYEFKLLKGLNPMQDIDSAQKKSDEEKQSDDNDDAKDNDQQLISLSDQEFTDANIEKMQEAFDNINKSGATGNGDTDSMLNFYDADHYPNDQSVRHDDVYHDIRYLDEQKMAGDLLLGDKDDPKKTEDNDNLLLGNFEGTDFQQPSQEDLELFNDILGEENKSGSDNLESEWHSVFGEFSQAPKSDAPPVSANHQPQGGHNLPPSAANPPQSTGYLPSQLMDMMMSSGSGVPPQMTHAPMGMQRAPHMNTMGYPPQQMGPNVPSGVQQPPSYHSMFGNAPVMGQQQQQQQQHQLDGKMGLVSDPQSKRDNKGNMAAWFNLFAELDPLQNPDALSNKKEQSKAAESGGGGGGAC